MNRLAHSSYTTSGGFTLLEVMIASAMGMVMLFATLSIFDQTNAAMARMTRTNEVFQTGVFAMNTMESDIKLAGFYGEGTAPSTAPVATPDPCSTTPSDWLDALSVPLQGWLSSSSGVPSCVPTSRVADSSVLAIRRASTCEIGTSNCTAVASNTPLVQVSQCSTDAGQVMTGVINSSLTLHARNCTSTAPVRQYYSRIYFVDSNNVSGDGIPTLKRRDLDSSGVTTVTVAQGVEQMRLMFGVDSVGTDGVADVWTSAPAAGDWSNIVSVKINLLMRGGVGDSTYVNTRAYQLGDLAVAASNDHFYRSLVTSLVRVNNIAGPREN